MLSSQQPGSSATHLMNLQALSVKREQDQNQYLFNPRPDSIPPWLACSAIGSEAAGPALVDSFPSHVCHCVAAKSSTNGGDCEQAFSVTCHCCHA
ncbi:hypothetical protein OIU78_002136 [Salix suchowensis]|nr:hypothetical protein OIU78_002136 [Salix suchowensis]